MTLQLLATAIIKTAINDYKFEHGPIRRSAETFLYPDCEESLEYFALICDLAGISKTWLHEKLRKMRAELRGKRYWETQNSAIARRKER